MFLLKSKPELKVGPKTALNKTVTNMTESTFKQIFIATFLASWCASNYEQYCMLGKQGELSKPPVEDAKHLADEAWQRIQEV